MNPSLSSRLRKLETAASAILPDPDDPPCQRCGYPERAIGSYTVDGTKKMAELDRCESCGRELSPPYRDDPGGRPLAPAFDGGAVIRIVGFASPTGGGTAVRDLIGDDPENPPIPA